MTLVTRSSKAGTNRGRTKASSTGRGVGRRRVTDRRRGAKRFRIVAGLTVVSTLAVASIAALNSSWFDVEAVTVVGFERADPERLVVASGVELGEPLVDVDLEAVAAGISAEPWVATAEVDRSWNGTILVTITERGPVAALPTGSGFALIDEEGQQLEVVADRPAGFLAITGIEASGEVGQVVPDDAALVVSLIVSLTPTIAEHVVGLELVDGEVLAALAAGGSVNFGNDQQLGQKMQTLDTMLAQADLSCIVTIDVSVPSAPAVVRSEPGEREGC